LDAWRRLKNHHRGRRKLLRLSRLRNQAQGRGDMPGGCAARHSNARIVQWVRDYKKADALYNM